MLVRSPFKRPFSKMCPTRLRYPCSSQKNPEFFCFLAAVVSRCFSSFSQLSWFGSSPACISEVAGILVNKLFQCFQPQNQLKNSRSFFAFCCAPSQTASLVGCSGYSDRTANHRRRRFFLIWTSSACATKQGSRGQNTTAPLYRQISESIT